MNPLYENHNTITVLLFGKQQPLFQFLLADIAAIVEKGEFLDFKKIIKLKNPHVYHRKTEELVSITPIFTVILQPFNMEAMVFNHSLFCLYASCLLSL
jgi:hypothetical protein